MERHYYNPPTTPSTTLDRVSDAGRNGVTPEAWNDILKQMQHLINENDRLSNTLAKNNERINGIIKEKDNKIEQAQKLYWDARVSVIGFKSKINKLDGELSEAKSNESKKQGNEYELELEKLKLEKEKFEKEKLSSTNIQEQQKQKFQQEIDSLQQQLSDWQKQFKVTSNRLQSTLEENDELCEKLSQSTQRVTVLQNELQQKVAPPVPLPRTNKHQESEGLQREIQRLQFELEETSNQFKTEKQRHFELEKKWSHANLDKKELEDKNVYLMNQIDALKREKLAFKNQLDKKDDEIILLKQSIDRAEATETNSASPASGQSTSKMRMQLNEARGKIKRLEKELSDRSEQEKLEFDDKLHQYSLEKKSLQRGKEELEHLFNELERANADLSMQLQKSVHQNRELQQQVNEISNIPQETVMELEKGNAHLKSEIDTLRNKVINLEERANTYEIKLSQKESELQHYKSEADTESSSWEHIMNEMEKQIQELSKLKQSYKNLEDINETLKADKLAAIEDRDDTKKKLEKKQADCKEYLEHAQMWKEQFESARRDFEMERKIREKEVKAIDALRNNRNGLQAEVTELRKRVTEQQSIIAKIDPSLLPETAATSTVSTSPNTPRRTVPATDIQPTPPNYHKQTRFSGDQRYNNPVADQFNQPPFQGSPYQAGERPPSHGLHDSSPVGMPNRQQPPPASQYQQQYQQQYVKPMMPGGGYNDLNTGFPPSSPHNQSGGGHIDGSHFQQQNIRDMRSATSSHQYQGGYSPTAQTRPSTTYRPVDSQYHLPRQQQPIPQRPLQVYDGGILLPGDVQNTAKPTQSCPLCGKNDFTTQTELELHCAKCC